MKSLNQLRDEIHDWAKEKGWWDTPREFGTLIALCHSELSEALEEVRNSTGDISSTYYKHNYDPASYPLESEDFIIHTVKLPGGYVEDVRSPRLGGQSPEALGYERGMSIGKPEGVPSELADTIIRILDICGYYGIDIDEIVAEKMTYNETRSHRHGNKAM